MPTPENTYPTQHIGGTILVVMMEVDPAHEDEFNRWYNDEHLPERLEIPGYVSARRFKLEEGEGVLRYLCIWELEDGSPLQSEAYKAQQRRPSDLRDRVHTSITERRRGLYRQIYLPVGRLKIMPAFTQNASRVRAVEGTHLYVRPPQENSDVLDCSSTSARPELLELACLLLEQPVTETGVVARSTAVQAMARAPRQAPDRRQR